MMEDSRLAYASITDFDCYVCGTPFEIQRLKFELGDDTDFISDYDCHKCEAEYVVEVDVDEDGVEAYASRTDPEAPDNGLEFDISHSSTREALYETAHPARDLVQALTDLNKAASILFSNEERVMDVQQELESIDNLAEESLDSDPYLEIHNYLSSSYTFDQILETIKPDLPTGGPVAEAMETYNERRRVINGLRIYAQHHLIPEIGFMDYYSSEADEQRFALTIDLEEVSTIDSLEDGYENGVEHHYGHIDDDLIDVPLWTQRYSEAANELIETIWTHVEDTKGDDLEDYQEKTSR
ncbi:hypothetical protein [Haloplanus pelagicus]|jgi:hypothetical protein|uniref:hypothetical protein n=1 Tax=Haloplanus pelagicus TaxID=2949995 RepID=UPI00203A49E9|nr:hypothetical protein [Haloplanus sp. HW8-1]